MSKSTLFVVGYSFVLIGLFSTFCYLMTTVNPAPMKRDGTRKFGSDDVLYPNEFLLPNDNVAFGLEKADDYDISDDNQKVRPIKLSTVFKFTSKTSRSTKNARKAASNTKSGKGPITNCTRKPDDDFIRMVTKAIKVPLRGFRRSIKQNKEQHINAAQLFVLKIKHNDREPIIEIKVISETEKGKKSVVSNNNVNNANFAFDNENNTLIKLEKNDTLIINVLKKLKYESENDTNLVEDANIDKSNSNYTNDLENIYTINLLKDKINGQYNETRIKKETGESLSTKTSTINGDEDNIKQILKQIKN